MLLKLNVVTDLHLVKYKTRITHCNENSSLADFIATIKLDDGLSCDRYSLLEVLVGVGAFNEPTLFDKDSLDLVSFGELKKSLTGG